MNKYVVNDLDNLLAGVYTIEIYAQKDQFLYAMEPRKDGPGIKDIQKREPKKGSKQQDTNNFMKLQL